MEFERQQFSLYKFILKRLRVILWGVLLLSISILVLSLGLRFQYMTTPDTNYLGRCVDTYFQRYRTEKAKGYLLEPHQLMRVEIVTDELDPLYNETDCTIKQNELHNNSQTILFFFQEWPLEILPTAARRSHKVEEIYIALAMNKISHPQVYKYFGIEEIMTDKLTKQFARHFVNVTYMRDFSNLGSYMQLKPFNKKSIFVSILLRACDLFFAFYRFFIASIFCGILVIALNIFIASLAIPILEKCKRTELPYIASGAIADNPLPSSSFNQIFVQEHLNSFRMSSNPVHLKLAKYIIFAFIGAFFTLVIGTQGFVSFSADFIIGVYYTRANEVTMVMICVLEQLSLIFFRTRTSIKFGPSIITLIYCISFFMVEVYPYSLPQLYMYDAFWLSITVIMCLALFVQVPVMSCSEDANYKPTYNRPRTYYFPSFNIGWHNAVAPIWSYFVPQHPRDFFSQVELSYVDRNYDLLYAQLMGLPTSADSAGAAPNAHLQPEEFMMI